MQHIKSVHIPAQPSSLFSHSQSLEVMQSCPWMNAVVVLIIEMTYRLHRQLLLSFSLALCLGRGLDNNEETERGNGEKYKKFDRTIILLFDETCQFFHTYRCL